MACTDTTRAALAFVTLALADGADETMRDELEAVFNLLGDSPVSSSASHLTRSLRSVPRLSEFYGIVIYMYWKDHQPPHFHAIYAGNEALVRIDDGTFLAGSLPRTAGRLVREWTELRRAELIANWERAQAPDTLVPVEPLQ